MIIGTGVDIVSVSRFERADGERFTARCFTERELAYLASRSGQNAAQSKAGLFAAKEAVVKALGTGFRGFWPNAVEILHDALGRPYAVLHGEAARVAKHRRITRIWVSITHETVVTAAAENEKATLAMAVAVAERADSHADRNRRANARHRGLRRS